MVLGECVASKSCVLKVTAPGTKTLCSQKVLAAHLDQVIAWTFPFLFQTLFAVIHFSSKDLKRYGINLLMVMDGRFDNLGLCF